MYKASNVFFGTQDIIKNSGFKLISQVKIQFTSLKDKGEDGRAC